MSSPFPVENLAELTSIVAARRAAGDRVVMTNGNFDTQVLANEMWQRAFTELNFGLGSALAFLLFIAVVPVMWLNIRRMQKQRESVG